MLLSQYDIVTCLCVDGRYGAEWPRVRDMLKNHGVADPRLYLNGRGALLPAHLYDKINLPPPAGWAHGEGAYWHFEGVKAIIRQAKEEGADSVLLVEDDCVLTEDHDRVAYAAASEIIDHGIQWDILYYGANHAWAVTEEVTPHVLKVEGSLTTHCVGFRSSSFDAMLGLAPNHVIDRLMADILHHSLRCYAIWPSVAIQKPGYSYLSYKQMNYAELFKQKGVNW
jgi:hypothetical protein